MAIRRALLYSAITILTLGCGKKLSTVGFDEYVRQFEEESARYGAPVRVDNLIVRFANIPQPRTIAECVTETWKTPLIRVDQQKWSRFSDSSRRLVIFHEMGHCVLDRRHRGELRRNGTPASIMYQHNVPEEVFNQEPDYYLTELFDRSFRRSPAAAPTLARANHLPPAQIWSLFLPGSEGEPDGCTHARSSEEVVVSVSDDNERS